MKTIARINTTPQVLRACICMIRSILQVAQRVPPTCTILTYTFITLFWRSSPEYFSLIAGWDKFCKRLPFLCGVCRWPINRPSTCNANVLHRRKKSQTNILPSVSMFVNSGNNRVEMKTETRPAHRRILGAIDGQPNQFLPSWVGDS